MAETREHLIEAFQQEWVRPCEYIGLEHSGEKKHVLKEQTAEILRYKGDHSEFNNQSKGYLKKQADMFNLIMAEMLKFKGRHLKCNQLNSFIYSYEKPSP